MSIIDMSAMPESSTSNDILVCKIRTIKFIANYMVEIDIICPYCNNIDTTAMINGVSGKRNTKTGSTVNIDCDNVGSRWCRNCHCLKEYKLFA